MRKIVLATDEAFYWKYIESCFESINADMTVFPPGAPDEEIAASGAGLLVMGFDRIAPLGSPLRRFRTIVISDRERAFPEQTRASRDKILFLQWPVAKDQLLLKAADMLGISPRKTFRATVRIFSPDAAFGVLGTSLDFSSTGMSFVAERYYSIGHEVSVKISVPGEGERLTLPGRVARSWTNESDGTSEYGVEFRPLESATAGTLKRFILS
jgi:hypothetical protein